MNDKNIRNILIAYLQAVHDRVRIYQEKSIGSSVCDVMAVTDCLTGYEIKSDCDNYARLQKQVGAYTAFFDKNYIVVSERHLKTVYNKVPDSWGIIAVMENDIRVDREAKFNEHVSRRSQLSILWKLELKNLLVKNEMPMFAQREKGYIASRIAETVSPETLGMQIAQELMERDYSVFDAEDYTIHSDSSYIENRRSLPQLDIIDTLSEENLSEFTLDKWIRLYQKAREIQNEKEKRFRQKTERNVINKIPYTDIEVSLGVPWVSPAIVDEFITHLLDMKYPYGNYNGGKWVKYEPVTGSWSVECKRSGSLNVNATVKYGLERYNALCIIEATLNLREIKLFDYGIEYNETDTIAALEKQKLINEEFENWVWEDEDRRWEIENTYNKMFAGFEKCRYDGSRLSFPDMNPEFELYPYQKDAVQKIISTPNTLLAFDVGAGKTYIMIAAAMKMRSEGISRKNMFVVPNNIVGQWEKIFTTLYPKARLLTIEPKVYKPQMRSKVLSQIKDGDYDGIIIAYSCFEMIPLSLTYLTNEMNRQLSEIDMAVGRLKGSSSWVWESSKLEKEKDKIRNLTYKFLDSMKYKHDSITFDMLEINTIFLDEAHNYKNIPLHSRMKNINGINITGSPKCTDMMQKIRCVQQHNGGRGAVFATGTPLCNSISDAYAMQMYLQYDDLCKINLEKFDNWVKTFALPEQLCEIDVDTSKFRFVRRFSKFFNLPELSKMFSGVAVFHAMTTSEGLPVLEDYSDVVIEKNQPLMNYMQKLCDRTELIRNKEVDRCQDNMLKVSTDGRKAALDLKLVGERQPDDTSKVLRCGEKVMEIYKEHEGCSQLVFCDYSTPKGERFNVYSKLQEYLVQKGIPENEIAFIHSYNTESRKLSLYKKVNEGIVRVLIGSTFKLGIGANVQTKLKAVHHLDVPWRPADMIQREGRIIRRGNENKSVFIYRYIAEGSFDAYSWQVLETKQRFISQFLNGSSYQRTASDLEGNILTYAEVKALALSSPHMKELAEKENELRNLNILRIKHDNAMQTLENELKEIPEKMPDMTAAKNNLEFLSGFDSKRFSGEYQKIKNSFAYNFITGGEKADSNLSVLDFRIILPENQNKDKPYIFLERNGGKYYLEMGESTLGNGRRIINFLKGFEKTYNKLSEYKQKLIKRKEEIECELQKPKPYNTQINECQKRIDVLKSKIELYENDNF